MNTQLHVLENENSESDLDSQLRYENHSMGKKKRKIHSSTYLLQIFFIFPQQIILLPKQMVLVCSQEWGSQGE